MDGWGGRDLEANLREYPLTRMGLGVGVGGARGALDTSTCPRTNEETTMHIYEHAYCAATRLESTLVLVPSLDNPVLYSTRPVQPTDHLSLSPSSSLMISPLMIFFTRRFPGIRWAFYLFPSSRGRFLSFSDITASANPGFLSREGAEVRNGSLHFFVFGVVRVVCIMVLCVMNVCVVGFFFRDVDVSGLLGLRVGIGGDGIEVRLWGGGRGGDLYSWI